MWINVAAIYCKQNTYYHSFTLILSQIFFHLAALRDGWDDTWICEAKYSRMLKIEAGMYWIGSNLTATHVK